MRLRAEGDACESRLEGSTLVVRIPMRLGQQRGRKRIPAPGGSELTPPTKPQPDGVLVQALARARRWQKLLDRGVYSSVTEIAETEKVSKSYVSRIVRLALLAPDLVEAILTGWADQRVMLEWLERPPPMGWEEQRALFGGARQENTGSTQGSLIPKTRGLRIAQANPGVSSDRGA